MLNIIRVLRIGWSTVELKAFFQKLEYLKNFLKYFFCSEIAEIFSEEKLCCTKNMLMKIFSQKSYYVLKMSKFSCTKNIWNFLFEYFLNIHFCTKNIWKSENVWNSCFKGLYLVRIPKILLNFFCVPKLFEVPLKSFFVQKIFKIMSLNIFLYWKYLNFPFLYTTKLF